MNPNTSYKFSITSYNGDTVATNRGGKVTSVANVSLKTKAYAAPTGIKTTVTSGSIILSWKASPFAETTKYEVVCYNAWGGFEKTVETTSLFMNFSDLTPSTTYKFEIRAVSDMLCAVSDAPGIGKSLKPAKVTAKTKK